MKDEPKAVKPIEISYEEPSFGEVKSDDIRVETIFGSIPYVTSTPTWVPKSFRDTFALYKSGATKRLYTYDNINNAWYYVALT